MRLELFDRTLGSLKRALRGRSQSWSLAPDLPQSDSDLLRQRIDACLGAPGGEVSARARAAELGRAYLALNPTGRERFLQILANEYGVVDAEVEAAITARRTATDDVGRVAAERQLRAALLPPSIRLLRQFNGLPQGVKFLVDLRAELLPLARGDAALKALDNELRELLASWFDIGFLALERITWEAPAALLEKLIAYEAVHEIRSWHDLKNRLDSDRRLYAFFHPSMPDEPLIFVQVALVSGIADNVQALLDETAPSGDPEDADTAIFYSISNAQAGLAGVSFGNFLIKRVADHLSRNLPNLKTFSTLSPVPGFRAWLDLQLDGGEGEALFTASEAQDLSRIADNQPPGLALRTLLAAPGWYEDEAAAAALKPVLMRLGARYLLEVKRGDLAHDRVAHFHLSNGARLERINWLADTSENGLRQSAGLMVNYLYDLSEIDKNHEAYTGENRIAAASAVRRLARD